MDSIRLRGGTALKGTIHIAGAKNAALPLLTAGLLTAEPLRLANVPHLADITTLVHLLGELGCAITLDGQATDHLGHEGRVFTLATPNDASTTAPYDLVRKMRASVLVLGPLVARFGHAKVSLPGGCAIGTRPVDLHLKALEAMGAEIELEDGYVIAKAPNGLKGALVRFPKVSVGATENAVMAAVLAQGTTILDNAAREPEVQDLCHCLVAMGAKINGIGEERIEVEGVDQLHGATYSVLPDRIEAGSYAIAAAITHGDVYLKGAAASQMHSTLDVLMEAGIEVIPDDAGIRVRAINGIKAVDVETQPFPGFATDMQAQFMTLMTQAEGVSSIAETVFENRFMHVPELVRMGADIAIHGHTAIVKGPCALKGAPVMATDLRASMSLILAGLAASGETIVNRVYHLDRGYEHLEEKLAACGADVERISARS